MEALGCRPAGDCKCCEDYCVDHWVSFDENGLCPDARKVADAVEATHEWAEYDEPDDGISW